MFHCYAEVSLLCLAAAALVAGYPHSQLPNNTMCQKMVSCYNDNVRNQGQACVLLDSVDKMNRLTSCHLTSLMKQLEDLQQVRLQKIVECIQRRTMHQHEVEIDNSKCWLLKFNPPKMSYPVIYRFSTVRFKRAAREETCRSQKSLFNGFCQPYADCCSEYNLCELQQHELTHEIDKLALKLQIRARECANVVLDVAKDGRNSGFSRNMRMEEHKTWNFDDSDFDRVSDQTFDPQSDVFSILHRLHVRSADPDPAPEPAPSPEPEPEPELGCGTTCGKGSPSVSAMNAGSSVNAQGMTYDQGGALSAQGASQSSNRVIDAKRRKLDMERSKGEFGTSMGNVHSTSFQGMGAVSPGGGIGMGSNQVYDAQHMNTNGKFENFKMHKDDADVRMAENKKASAGGVNAMHHNRGSLGSVQAQKGVSAMQAGK